MFTLRTYCIYAGSKRVAVGLGALVLLDCVLKVVSSSLHVEKRMLTRGYDLGSSREMVDTNTFTI